MNKNKDPDLKLLSSSWELWDFIVKKAGLDLQNYDTHIVENLCNQLGIPPPYTDIRSELKRRNISQELFLSAFMKSLQPYAQMMKDLCVFFWTHGVKETNEGMRILFDFGRGPEDLGFDLKHFREILWKYETLLQTLVTYHWKVDTLWGLWRVFNDYNRRSIEDQVARNWIENYDKHGEFGLPLPTLQLTGLKEIDSWLEWVWQVWSSFTLECRRHSTTRKGLHELGIAGRQQHQDKFREEEVEQELIKHQIKLPQVSKWDMDTLFIVDHDRWPESMLRGLFGFSEHLLQLPVQERLQEAVHIIKEIQHLFSTIPYTQEEIEDQLKKLIEVLNLPFWKKRHELYQTWVLTQIDQALARYPPKIHHSKGTLIFKYNGTHLGTIETKEGRIHIWTELRSPLDNPVGEGRTGHIQPDYTLNYEPITDPSQTVVAVECKQYKQANAKNFANALIDYARGCPSANILLVTYGQVPQNLLDRVDSYLRHRTQALGGFMPGNPEQIEIFRRRLLDILPEPRSKGLVIEDITALRFSLIVVDVSSSMDKLLDDQSILHILKRMITHSPSANLVAVDTSIKGEWTRADSGVTELLNLPRKGGTELPQALADYDLDESLVLTDSDGWSQLKKVAQLPALVIEISIDKSLHFHYSPEMHSNQAY